MAVIAGHESVYSVLGPAKFQRRIPNRLYPAVPNSHTSGTPCSIPWANAGKNPWKFIKKFGLFMSDPIQHERQHHFHSKEPD